MTTKPELDCGCTEEESCFHQPCQPGRMFKWGLAVLIENPYGHVQVADPNELHYYPDGSVEVVDHATF